MHHISEKSPNTLCDLKHSQGSRPWYIPELRHIRFKVYWRHAMYANTRCTRVFVFFYGLAYCSRSAAQNRYRIELLSTLGSVARTLKSPNEPKRKVFLRLGSRSLQVPPPAAPPAMSPTQATETLPRPSMIIILSAVTHPCPTHEFRTFLVFAPARWLLRGRRKSTKVGKGV
jgi:hypothetical protein